MSNSTEEKELTELKQAFASVDADWLAQMLYNKLKLVGALEENSSLEPDAPYQLYDSSTFPEEPISPSLLAAKVSEKLVGFGSIVPDKTSIMVEELCRSFNECIRLNTNNEKAQTLILSPKTGAAKSVSSKMYVALLQSQASIIVVYSVKDAIKTCEDINAWSGNNNYARCYFANDKHPLRVEKDKLAEYRCIVISHELFKRANTNESIEYLSHYKKMPREFVLIDERINLHRTLTFPIIHLNKLVEIFEKIQDSLELKHLENEIKFLKDTTLIFETIKNLFEINMDVVKDKFTKDMEDKKFTPIDGEFQKQYGLTSFDFTNFQKLLDTKKINLQKIVDPLSLMSTKDFNATIKDNLMRYLNILSTILKYKFYYITYSSIEKSPVIMVTKNIINSFGSYVVLDATASVNQIYYDKVLENPDTVKHINTTNPRRYNNLTIYQCKGIPQGKGSIYKNLSEKTLKESVEIYTNLANSLLKKEDDILLIITHKDFKVKLEEKISNEAIKFTHWGNHRGTNEFNYCNKVLVIGWLHLPAEVHYENYINAVNGVDHLSNERFLLMKRHYSITQIADDLVQGVNRSAIRNISSTEGDCPESEIYMFYPNGLDASDVLQQFQAEFDGVNIKPWKPKEVSSLLKLSKIYVNIETIVNYIEHKVHQSGEISQQNVEKYFDDKGNAERLNDDITHIPSSTFSRYVSEHEEFTILLHSKGLKRMPINSKSYKFTTI